MSPQNDRKVIPNYNLDFSSRYNDYSKMVSLIQQEQSSNDNKYNEIKARVNAFENVSTLEEAKTLAKKNFPTTLEKTSFYVGNAKCIVVNKEDVFRIILDSDTECICYEFV